VDSLAERILKVIRGKGCLKEIAVVQGTERAGQVWYHGKPYVPEGDQLRLRLIQGHHDTALAGHSGRAKMFDLLA